MTDEITLAWLWLVMVLGVSSKTLLYLLEEDETGIELMNRLWAHPEYLDPKQRERLHTVTLDHARKVAEECERKGIGILHWEDARYPERLRRLEDAPGVLFYRGDVSLLNYGPLLTSVGTRHPSNYSVQVTRWLCTDLARSGILIVSGCAMGLDSISHQAALDAGKPTIGVLGCGVDYDYPRENRALREQIAQQGLLLSEYFPGSTPHRSHFPLRNRILAGISEATIVFEASARSGSLITAEYTVNQGKNLLCIPPADLFDPRYSGVMNYLRDGAYPVFNHLDVLYTFYMAYPHKMALYDDETVSRTKDSLIYAGEEQTEKTARRRRTVHAVQTPDAAPDTQKAPFVIPEEATEMQRKLLQCLQNGEQNINALCCEISSSFEETSVQLMEMEMLGWVVNVQRDCFALAPCHPEA